MQTPYERFGLTRSVMPAASNWRKMYDAMGENAPVLLAFTPQLIGAYVTGSTSNPQIVWTPADRALFPHAEFADIDQAGNGSPVRSAKVMDVEPNAFGVADIPSWTSQSTAPRPTVYCDRNDYPSARKVWSKDLWLAWPGASYVMVQEFATQTLGHPDPNIVACQNLFTPTHDVSDVFDPTWPNVAKPVGGEQMISGTLIEGEADFAPFPAGSHHGIMLYQDFVTTPAMVRVAMHSVSRGYNQIIPFEITESIPLTILFEDTDVDGVSLVNMSNSVVGYTVI